MTKISTEEITSLEGQLSIYRRNRDPHAEMVLDDMLRKAAPALIAMAKSNAELRMMLNDAKDELYEIRKSRDAANKRADDMESLIAEFQRRAARLLSPPESEKGKA